MTRIAEHPGAPDGYYRLTEYFGSVSDRADALGVGRDTIRAWDTRSASKLRAASRRRVSALVMVCRDLGAVMSEPAAVGRWLLTEQPGLMGARPTDVLLKLGSEGARFIVQVAYGVAPVRPGDVPDAASFWRAVQAKLSEDDLAQVERTRERAAESAGSLSLA